MVKKSKKNQQNGEDEIPKLTKEETAIARYLRLKCPNKQGNCDGIKVDFFIGNKIVDNLMESKWGPGTLQDPPKYAPYVEGAKTPLLETRHACFKYMQQLMRKQLFARAIKIYKEQPSESIDETPSSLRRRKAKEVKGEDNPESTPNKSSPQAEKKEPKKKFKLEMHEDQRFIDDNEPYVWYYDPTSTTSSIIGGLLILGSIGICCFPLWPSIVREGVYYLSLSGCGFLGSIIGLAVIKYIIFAILYVITLGAVELWIFPNLTEDVGFVESFLPIYSLKMSGKESNKIESEKNKTEDKEVEPLLTETTPVEEENVTKENLEINAEKLSPKPISGRTSSHQMHDLTESTVEVSTINSNSGENKDINMEKIQEDYDFEIIDEQPENDKNNEENVENIQN